MTTNQPAHGHYFRKVDGVWTCKCGETRDNHGKSPNRRRRPFLTHLTGK